MTKRLDKTPFLIVSLIFAVIDDVMTLEGVGQHAANLWAGNVIMNFPIRWS